MIIFCRNDLDGDSKPMTTLKSLEESSPPSNLNIGRMRSASRDSHESNLEIHAFRRLEPAMEGPRSNMVSAKSNGKERTENFSNSGSVKLDLNCHETDSAIVTSSSDIIAVENSDNDVHSNFTGSSTSGDEKVGSFEPGKI